MAYNEKLGYCDETQALIERMCRYVERPSFRLQKEKAQGLILQTYDLFGLPRPKQVVWCVDILGKTFNDAASSASSAWSAWSAWSASSAWSAWSAWSASSASSASSAWSAWSARSASSASSASSAWSARSASSASSASSAWSARSASSAWSAWSASSAWSAWSAIDIDFNWSIAVYENSLHPLKGYGPNDNDRLYLQYSELLLQALEAGAGYRVEWEDTLYIAPTPLVKIDSQSRFHSEDGPAIRWKQGHEFYYLYGENFDKKLWGRITSGNFTAKELMEIDDSDQRSIALTYLVPRDMLEQLKARHLHTGVKGNKLYEIKNYLGSDKTEYALWMKDGSTDREFISFVPKDFDFHNNADEATAGMYRRGDGERLPLEDYLAISEEA